MFPKNKKEHCEILSSESILKVTDLNLKSRLIQANKKKVLKKVMKKAGYVWYRVQSNERFFSVLF